MHARTLFGSSWLKFVSPFTSSTYPFISSPISSSLSFSCSSCYFTPSVSLSLITCPRTSTEELGTLAKKNSSTGCWEPNDTSLRRLMLSTPRSPQASSVSLMTWTTMAQLSVRLSSTRAEDEPITLKKKVCRLVCRRHQVMIERRNPWFVATHVTSKVEKFRDKTLKANRFDSPGSTKRANPRWLSSEDQKTRTPGWFRRRSKPKLNETNNRVAERSIQKLKETMESQKEEIYRAHQAEERCRRDQQLLHEQLLKQN